MPIYASGKRVNMYPSPSRKHMMVFQNFGGGMNSVTANENLIDSESPMLVNVDLKDRGSITRRTGFFPVLLPTVTGKGQGYFRYYRSANDFDEILAIDGKLYKNNEYLEIEGLEEGFQTDYKIEAVQFRQILYIATGTKLVQYDGEKAKVVEPYRPQPLEALYVGTNGLADNPDDFMQDGVSNFARIDGVTLDKRYGIAGQDVRITAWVSKPSNITLEYKFDYRMSKDVEGKWTSIRGWGEDKHTTFVTKHEGEMEIRVQLRDKANPTRQEDTVDEEGNPTTITVDNVIDTYFVPKFIVKPSYDPSDEKIDSTTIHSCTKIILHWNRLIMYGDPNKPSVIYISHLNRGDYFPTVNTLDFENGKQEGIQRIVQYRDMLVAFTDSTIQALFGTSPIDFKRVVLNTDIGAIAPDSVRVMKNHIVFLSKEGIHILKSVGQVLDKANVEKIDTQIDNLVPLDTDAIGIVHNNQYRIVFPSRNIGFRYYYEDQVWVMDESERFDISQFYIYDTFLYAQKSTDGRIVAFLDDVYDDEGYVYQVKVVSRYFDFGEPYHPKKLKELQLMLDREPHDESINVYVYADKERVWNVAEDDTTSDREMWKIGKAYYDNENSAVYRLRLSGKCRQTKIVITQEYNKPFQLFGFGFKFKTKTP